MIPIASPDIGEAEIEAVVSVLRSGSLVQGPKVAELEEKFAAYCGTKYAVAVNSGTAALHAALFAAGVGPGDEVITTPFSFIGTVNPILYIGAKPVFVDIDPVTFTIDVNAIEQAITPKTKAILPVHLYGQPCDPDALRTIASAHNLPVIEDACQAVGATYGDKKTGSLGDMGCFSLYATKNIMSGEGGIVTTDNEEYAATIKRFRQNGMSAPYVYEHIGYNYRMPDMLAAIALEQLKKVDTFNNARKQNAAVLSSGLQEVSGLKLPVVAEGRSHVFHQYTVRVTDDFGCTRDELIAKLAEQEIGAGVYYPRPLHYYKHVAEQGYVEGDFPKAELAARQVVSLPVHPKVTSDDLAHIINGIRTIKS